MVANSAGFLEGSSCRMHSETARKGYVEISCPAGCVQYCPGKPADLNPLFISTQCGCTPLRCAPERTTIPRMIRAVPYPADPVMSLQVWGSASCWLYHLSTRRGHHPTTRQPGNAQMFVPFLAPGDFRAVDEYLLVHIRIILKKTRTGSRTRKQPVGCLIAVSVPLHLLALPLHRKAQTAFPQRNWGTRLYSAT